VGENEEPEGSSVVLVEIWVVSEEVLGVVLVMEAFGGILVQMGNLEEVETDMCILYWSGVRDR